MSEAWLTDDFDPNEGSVPVDDASVLAVFPDAQKLIDESVEQQLVERNGDWPEWAHGPADEYRVTNVPNTSIYVLFGIYPNPDPDAIAEGIILVVYIREYEPKAN